MMGMMMLARMIMYFCGDYDSWDMRSLMMGMGGGMGMMGGGMGGMGGGMMGGMGGGMGGMMRSVPPTGLPFADLEARPDAQAAHAVRQPDATGSRGSVRVAREGRGVPARRYRGGHR